MSRVTRQELRRLVDRVPDTCTAMAPEYLEGLIDPAREGPPAIESLPVDKRALSAEAIGAIEEGMADHEAGRTRTLEEVEREFGP